MEKVEERPVEFLNEGLLIRGFIYPGSQSDQIIQNWGYVFCDPFAEERRSSLRVFVDFARLLRKMDRTVLRFDYRGCGDSEGDFRSCTISSMCADIVAAIEFLTTCHDISHLGLLGIRLSTNLILRILPRIPRVSQLILWEPVLDAEAYFRKILRKQLMKDLMTFGRIRQSRKQMMQALLQRSCIDFEGYEISRELFEESKNTHQVDWLHALPEDILLVNLSITGRPTHEYERINRLFLQRNPNTNSRVLKSLPIWNNHDIPEYRELFEETGSWIKML